MNFKHNASNHPPGSAPAGEDLIANPQFKGARIPGWHLSEDQIDDHLIGHPAAAAAAHLAECELCVSRVAAAAAPIQAFRVVTLAWAERRSATLPLHRSLARASKFHPRLAWAAAVIVALALGVAIPVMSHQERTETAHVTVQVPVTTVSNDASANDQIVRDNQMLKAIDRELDASADTPAALGLQPVNSPAASKPEAPPSVQD